MHALYSLFAIKDHVSLKQFLTGYLSAFISIAILSIIAAACNHTHPSFNPKNRIVVEVKMAADFSGNLPKDANTKNGLRIEYWPLHYIESTAPVKSIESKIDTNLARYEIFSDEYLLLTPQPGCHVIVHAGDSIHINYKKEKAFLSGRGSDSAKFNLLNQLSDINNQLAKPATGLMAIRSPEEYLQWNTYIDRKIAIQLNVLESYHGKIDSAEYDYYKAQVLSNIESERVNAFSSLQSNIAVDSLSTLTASDLNQVWDTTQYKPISHWLRELATYFGSLNYAYAFNRMEIRRKFNFNFSNDSLKNKALRTYLYYTHARNNYKGLLRERLMAFIVDEQAIHEMGLQNPTTTQILTDYYDQPDFPEYKAYVKSLEEKAKK